MRFPGTSDALNFSIGAQMRASFVDNIFVTSLAGADAGITEEE